MTLDNDSNDYVSSVSWIQQGGSHLAVGTATNGVQLWDVQAGRQIRSLGKNTILIRAVEKLIVKYYSLDGHSSRVGALAWNSHLLTSGGRDNLVINHDVRIQNHIVGKMAHHTQEVCGLAW